MNPWVPFVVFLVIGTAWTVAWGWTIARAGGPPAAYDPIYRGGGWIRRRLFAALIVVLGAAFLASLWWLPYRGVAASRLGAPTARVTVTARMWQWTLSRTQTPAGTPVEFDVTSVDVNHGFGIYGASGHLVAQVQAMPGYTNHLIVRLQPGRYVVRCLEYCGVPHIGMLTAFDVK